MRARGGPSEASAAPATQILRPLWEGVLASAVNLCPCSSVESFASRRSLRVDRPQMISSCAHPSACGAVVIGVDGEKTVVALDDAPHAKWRHPQFRKWRTRPFSPEGRRRRLDRESRTESSRACKIARNWHEVGVGPSHIDCRMRIDEVNPLAKNISLRPSVHCSRIFAVVPRLSFSHVERGDRFK